MPEFAISLEPQPPQPPAPPPSASICGHSHHANDMNSKSVAKLNHIDCNPKPQKPKPNLRIYNSDALFYCKSDSTIENPESDLSSESELRTALREDGGKCGSHGETMAVVPWRGGERPASANKSLDDFVQDWVMRRVKSGVPESRCFLPFLVKAPKLVECAVCFNLMLPGEDILCSVRGCQVVVHEQCAKERLHFSSTKQFKCPQHVCYACNKMNHIWRCIKCLMASHEKCAAFPEYVVHLTSHPGQAICWKHHADWRLQKEACSQD